MEIERKFLVDKIPADLEKYSHKELEQGYLCREPVVRVRREGEAYVLTYKSKGLMVREEYNLPLNKEAYEHLLKKADGTVITKTRYVIPQTKDLKIELDIFHGKHPGTDFGRSGVCFGGGSKSILSAGMVWGRITFRSQYHNSVLSME